VSRGVVDGMVAAGELTLVHRGVYLVRGAPLTYEARLWAGVLATGGVLGFGTAGQLWGTADRAPSDLQLIVRRGLHCVVPPRVRVHRIDVPPANVVRRHGLPVTDRATSVLDQLGRLPAPAARQLADRALQQGWLDIATIEHRLRAHPGRTGNRMLRRLLAECGDGAAAESERILHGLLRGAGLRGWVANHDVWLDGQLVGVVDLAFVECRVAVEVDGWAFHTGRERFQRDRTKQNALTAAGWTVLRFTWADLVDRPGYVVATIRQQVAAAA
jgi:very-short-patch-repair endonuclease